MSTRVWWSAGVGLVVAMMLVSGCASTGASAVPLPPAKMLQPADLASLAGDWHGSWRGARGTSPTGAGLFVVGDVTFAPDGSYTSNVSGVPAAGKARIGGAR